MPSADETTAVQDQLPPHAQRGMDAAMACLQAGAFAQGVDVVAATAQVDLQRHQGAWLRDGRRAKDAANLYKSLLSAAGVYPRPAHPLSSGHRTRVLFVTFQVCQGQAAAVSLARWLELIDPTRFSCGVLVADELSERSPPLGVIDRPAADSLTLGGLLLNQMLAHAPLGISVLHRHGSWIDAARSAITQAESLKPDVAVYIASPACPVQAAMMLRRVAPVQVNMNIGVPLPMAGVDAVIYHNPVRQRLDRLVLAREGIEPMGITTIGTDLRPCEGIRPIDRARIGHGVPQGAVLTACIASNISRRLLFDGYINDLAAFLRRHADVWWMGIGGGPTQEVVSTLAAAGVADRCVLTGPVADPRPLIAAADCVLNEYPEGGGNTVLESMALGVPVVAMHAGDRHAQCIGAVLTGPHAVPDNNRGAYWSLASRWVSDAGERRRVGLMMRQTALASYDYRGTVPAYEQLFTRLLADRAVKEGGPDGVHGRLD